MKKMIIGTLAILFLTSATGIASMGGGGMGSGSGGGHGSSMMGGSHSNGGANHQSMHGGSTGETMVHHGPMMRSMGKTMVTMGTMVQGMPENMTRSQRRDMTKMMKGLSRHFDAMAGEMSSETVDKARIEKMNRQMIDQMQGMMNQMDR
ncbi:hypothetical protein [Desulfoluna butyratoxydans]|uniref:Uncharacterized protein n=1 Tax=Desulfoluna butyratoxydans TaxID=231438 RepID=A0A4U8YJU2_9BACT|nr:hypothetical protein [Desulfoluna butyratoxydans]VFQ44055.1 hypothetical protein MSL71_16990 [Desulfoluna butyratoxydans]